MSEFINDVEALIETILESDDTDHMEDMIALFMYNNKVMPASDEFEIIM